MKLCRECKHYYIEYTKGAFRIPIYGIGDYCSRNATRDPVHGDVPFQYREQLIECKEYRAEVGHIENKCGPEGKHWEER
jgi:hypothetical protein